MRLELVSRAAGFTGQLNAASVSRTLVRVHMLTDNLVEPNRMRSSGAPELFGAAEGVGFSVTVGALVHAA